MKQQQTNKHSNLHREDQHITVEELWRGWKTSEGGSKGLSHPLWTHSREACLMFCFFFSSFSSSCLYPVHNWTMEDTVQWLKDSVELPQYEKNFRDFRVTGNTLPRSGPTSSLFQRGFTWPLQQLLLNQCCPLLASNGMTAPTSFILRKIRYFSL